MTSSGRFVFTGTMGHYIKRFARVGHSLGPSEERGFTLWVGYDLDGFSGDLSECGLVNVDGWPEEALRDRGVTSFLHVGADDEAMLETLGIKGRLR